MKMFIVMVNKMFNNKNHPELKEGEMWLSNGVNLYKIGYKTKRMGGLAFNKYGEIITELHPIFVQISEYNEVQNAYKHKRF